VLGYALERELLEQNPVIAFRQVRARKNRTQRGRAASDKARFITPIEDADELERLVGAAQAEGLDAYVLLLLCLDAGLRWGEAVGLRWGHVLLGEDERDARRALSIEDSRPRSGKPGPTKSGRARRVGLSKRLRAALLELYRSKLGPAFEAHVLRDFDPSVFRRSEWRRILKAAKIGQRNVKDLRDTFASQLLTAGVQLGYVSAQLGHSNVAVTAQHYAKWPAVTLGAGRSRWRTMRSRSICSRDSRKAT
jgi:integrase